MEKESKSCQMDRYLKDGGRIIWLMGTADLLVLKVSFMKECGKMDCGTGMEGYINLMATSTKEISSKTLSMVLVPNFQVIVHKLLVGLIKLYSKDLILKIYPWLANIFSKLQKMLKSYLNLKSDFKMSKLLTKGQEKE